MKNSWETYGAAFRGGKILAARVVNDGVKLTVTSLLTSDDNPSGESLDSGQLIFNVNENQAIVKNIDIKAVSGFKVDDLVRFELSQALLDPPTEYYYDALPIGETNGYRRFLTIAYHRREIDRQIDEYSHRLRKPSGFRLNSVALARGYLTFCRRDQEDLQILVDVDCDGCIMTTLYKNSIYGINRLTTLIDEKDMDSQALQLAREIKMTIAFQLARLVQDDIAIEPGQLTLSGKLAESDLFFDTLKNNLSLKVARPVFNLDHFQPTETTIDKYSPALFLIPLGLAVT